MPMAMRPTTTPFKTTIPLVIVLLATFIGFNYGANLALFPSYTKDLWGLKSFGMNYGLLFTAWGAGGFVFPRLQQMLSAASNGSFNVPLEAAGLLLVVSALLALAIRPPRVAR